MKKKYLFLLVLLPTLCFGQKPQYSIEDTSVVKTTAQVVATAPIVVSGISGKTLYVREDPLGYLTIESKFEQSDDRYGFLVIHNVVYKGVYRIEDNGTLTQQSLNVVSNNVNYFRSGALWLAFLIFFIISLAFGSTDIIQNMWLNVEKISFPWLQVNMRIASFFLYALVIYFTPALFGGSTRFPWAIASAFLALSTLILVVNYFRARSGFRFRMAKHW